MRVIRSIIPKSWSVGILMVLVMVLLLQPFTPVMGGFYLTAVETERVAAAVDDPAAFALSLIGEPHGSSTNVGVWSSAPLTRISAVTFPGVMSMNIGLIRSRPCRVSIMQTMPRTAW